MKNEMLLKELKQAKDKGLNCPSTYLVNNWEKIN